MSTKPSIYQIIPVIIISIFIVAGIVLAWTEPTAPPPQNNVWAPLNVSSIGQSKAGGLIINTGGAATGLIVDQGNVGIGTQTPAQKLDVAGIIQTLGFKMPTGASAGKVLTSDANGVGTWQTGAGGSLDCVSVNSASTCGAVYATCPSGYILTGGGYTLTRWGTHINAPDASGPSGNSWYLGMPTPNASCFIAWARCCKLQ